MLTTPFTSDSDSSVRGTKAKAAVPRTKSTAKHSRPGGFSSNGKATVLAANKENRTASLNQGRWTKPERIAFLRGLRRHGKSHWRNIARDIPTRDTTQTKTHAQTIMKTLAGGQNIFAELDSYEQDERRALLASAVGSPVHRATKAVCSSTRRGVSTPIFTWRPEDFDSATTLIMLKYSIRRL